MEKKEPYRAELLDLVSDKNNNMLRVMFDPDYMLHISVHESPNENGNGMYISREQAVLLQSLLNRHLPDPLPSSSPNSEKLSLKEIQDKLQRHIEKFSTHSQPVKSAKEVLEAHLSYNHVDNMVLEDGRLWDAIISAMQEYASQKRGWIRMSRKQLKEISDSSVYCIMDETGAIKSVTGGWIRMFFPDVLYYLALPELPVKG